MKKWICFLVLGLSLSLQAKTTIKVGVLAPEGTNWANSLNALSDEIKKITDGEVSLKIYFGGSQGDESDVLRKIRVGQLQGGIFTGKTLGEIYGDVRVLELPFTFENDQTKASSVLTSLTPYLNEGLAKNKFHNLGFFELGFVYFVSKKDVSGIDSLKGVKIWSWEGDPLVSSLIKSMELVSVPLPLPDVLASLQTGIIDAAYAPPMGILALQWNTKVKYLIDYPITFSVGAFLISADAWKKISPKHAEKINAACVKHIAEINKLTASDNKDALETMKSMGIEFKKFSEKDITAGKSVRGKVIAELNGKLFSNNTFSKYSKLIK